MTAQKNWSIRWGQGPILAMAVHNGHNLREEVRDLSALDEKDRLREEDPFTGIWTGIAPNRLVVNVSRFEVDLNRPRDQAVYLRPENAWGLEVWRTEPCPQIIERSLAVYDRFYEELRVWLDELVERQGWFVIYDLHSYCHRRQGPRAEPEPAAANPEINLGTGRLDRAFWAPVIDRFLTDLGRHDFLGRRLDVRENVRFRGGWLAGWVHERYPETGLVLAIEVKKFFMDEWTGEPDWESIAAVKQALAVTVPGVLEEMSGLAGLE